MFYVDISFDVFMHVLLCKAIWQPSSIYFRPILMLYNFIFSINLTQFNIINRQKKSIIVSMLSQISETEIM